MLAAETKWQECSSKQVLAEPKMGMMVAFKPSGSEILADIPAKVSYIWPRLYSGDYLLTLEYSKPIWYRNEELEQIDAFLSEVYQLIESVGAQTNRNQLYHMVIPNNSHGKLSHLISTIWQQIVLIFGVKAARAKNQLICLLHTCYQSIFRMPQKFIQLLVVDDIKSL